MKPTGWVPPPPSEAQLRIEHERAEAERELEAFCDGEPYEYRPFHMISAEQEARLRELWVRAVVGADG